MNFSKLTFIINSNITKKYYDIKIRHEEVRNKTGITVDGDDVPPPIASFRVNFIFKTFLIDFPYMYNCGHFEGYEISKMHNSSFEREGHTHANTHSNARFTRIVSCLH